MSLSEGWVVSESIMTLENQDFSSISSYTGFSSELIPLSKVISTFFKAKPLNFRQLRTFESNSRSEASKFLLFLLQRQCSPASKQTA